MKGWVGLKIFFGRAKESHTAQQILFYKEKLPGYLREWLLLAAHAKKVAVKGDPVYWRSIYCLQLYSFKSCWLNTCSSAANNLIKYLPLVRDSTLISWNKISVYAFYFPTGKVIDNRLVPVHLLRLYFYLKDWLYNVELSWSGFAEVLLQTAVGAEVLGRKALFEY